MRRFQLWVVLVVVALGLAACGGGEEPAAREAEVVDTTGAFQGLSPEEIRARAESMSPEMAESLGIIDTTIHIERAGPDDTLIPPAVLDTLR